MISSCSAGAYITASPWRASLSRSVAETLPRPTDTFHGVGLAGTGVSARANVCLEALLGVSHFVVVASHGPVGQPTHDVGVPRVLHMSAFSQTDPSSIHGIRGWTVSSGRTANEDLVIEACHTGRERIPWCRSRRTLNGSGRSIGSHAT